MDDVVSHSSVDSACDEFIVVNAEPKLKIGGNGNPLDLESTLTEVLTDDNQQTNKMSAEVDVIKPAETLPKPSEMVATDPLTIGV
jgi:hypothetical protein